ncbi:MAG: hypothetical protein E7377_01165 [Clostridiales bacterium]|nr:hypothetical protein [Clostridiales bacterium]
MTKKPLCAVVKANAYGHGAEEVTSALSDIVSCFAVALIEEGLAIRTAACGKDILVFTPPTDEEEGYQLAINHFTASVPDLYTARLLSKVGKCYRLPIHVHLKVNTGMNRYGMNLSMLGKVCKLLKDDPYVKVTGIYTHLCEYTTVRAEEQRTRFVAAEKVCRRYFPAVIAHLGGTYAATLGKKFAFDMTRIGIGLYGYLPTGEKTHALKKCMIVYAKTVSKRTVSYGGFGYGKALSSTELKNVKGKTFNLCRVGYADGFLRNRQNGTDGNERFVNELCMDAAMKRGCGRRGVWIPIMTDAEKTARGTGTISYEVLCAATRRAECIYDYD